MQRAVFFDRDGTLIEEKEYLHRPEDVVLFSDAVTALRRIANGGFKLFIVTNQSGVGRGYFTLSDVHSVHEYITGKLARNGIRFEKIYVAPEAPDQPSHGRKPSPQFLYDARDEFDLDLTQSYFIGDKFSDVECGWNAGVKKSILVRTGYGAGVEREQGNRLKNTVIVNNLTEAAEVIFSSRSL